MIALVTQIKAKQAKKLNLAPYRTLNSGKKLWISGIPLFSLTKKYCSLSRNCPLNPETKNQREKKKGGVRVGVGRGRWMEASPFLLLNDEFSHPNCIL